MAYLEVLPEMAAAECEAVQRGLQHWSESSGSSLFARQKELLWQQLALMPGEYLLQLGLPGIDLLPGDNRFRRVWLDIAECPEVPHLPRRLSLSDGGADIVIMPYVLESVVQPELVLREVRRVLVPGGNMLILLLAPYRNMPPLLRSRLVPLSRLWRAIGWLGCELVFWQKVTAAEKSSFWQGIYSSICPQLSATPGGWLVHARKSATAVIPAGSDNSRRGYQSGVRPVLSTGRGAIS